MSGTLTPITLLTGFLGSGKTSLLKRLIHQPEFAGCAVIINEFGDVGLDQALVSDSADDQDIQLLDSGCLCCLASSAIQDVLGSLYYRRLRKEIPWFDRVLIETSGLAEPGPIINSILGDGSLSRQYRVAGIITTLDAGFGETDIDTYREAELQLMMADTIVITKLDLQPQDRGGQLSSWLAGRNPTARILDNRLPDAGLAAALIASVSHATAATRQEPSTAAPSPLHHLFKYGITSVVADVPEPVSWPAWADFVQQVQHEFAERLLRFKGVLAFQTEEQTMAVHAVHHLFSPPQPVAGTPPGLIGKLVFIVRDMEPETVENAVSRLRAHSTNPS